MPTKQTLTDFVGFFVSIDSIPWIGLLHFVAGQMSIFRVCLLAHLAFTKCFDLTLHLSPQCWASKSLSQSPSMRVDKGTCDTMQVFFLVAASALLSGPQRSPIERPQLFVPRMDW